MKGINTCSLVLTMLFAMLSFTISAQEKKATEKVQKKVVIIQKHVNEDGQIVIEKTIGEGAEAEKILEEMAFERGDQNVNIHVIKNLSSDVEGEDVERLFLFRRAGGEKIEGRLEVDGPDLEEMLEGLEGLEGLKGLEDINIDFEFDDEEMHPGLRVVKRLYNSNTTGWHKEYGNRGKTNCAALGIYTTHAHHDKGVAVNNLIENGGAEAAGLLEGDYIQDISGHKVNSYDDLIEVLGKFIPEDVVKVTYLRGEKTLTTDVQLKAWREMPAMANTWRANVTCDDANFQDAYDFLTPIKEDEIAEETETPVLEQRSFNNTLALGDFQAFPNPSNGIFNIRFKTERGLPLQLRVVDITGKLVYTYERDRFDGSFSREINLSKSGSGTYILSIEQGDQKFSQQLIVQ